MSRRELFVTILLGFLATGLLAVARHAQALEERGDLAKSIQEIRDCGQLQPPSRWNGSRWVCDGLEVAKSIVRRVAEGIFGIDVTGTNRTEGNLLEAWGFSDPDKRLLQRMFFAGYYFPPQLDGGTGERPVGGLRSGGVPPAVAGDVTGPDGSVLAASTTSPQSRNEIRDWDSFLRDRAPPTKNPMGKAALLGLAALGRDLQLQQGLREVTRVGETLPLHQGEIGASGELPNTPHVAGQSTGAKQPSKVTDRIAYPAGVLAAANSWGVSALPFLSTIHGAYALHPAESPAEPSRPVVQEKKNDETKSPDSPGGGSGSGSASELVTGTPRDHSGLAAFGCSTCGGFASSAGGVGNFFGGGPLSQLQNRFPGGRLGSLVQLLGPNLFRDLLRERFSPGGTNAGGIPTTRELPPSGICASRTPKLNAQEVEDIAAFLGVPPTADPWQLEYRPVASVTGLVATNIRQQEETVVTPETFPNDDCVRVLTAILPDGSQGIVILSDRRSAEGTLLAVKK